MDQQPRDLWYGTRGPPDAPIVLVGESWGTEELNAKKPFVGTSGTELSRILAEAGVNENDVLFTNVVAEKPQGNETWRLFLPREGNQKTPRTRGLLPSDLVRSEVKRLYGQINSSPRKLVISTGNFALWALSNCTGSNAIRESNNRAIPVELQTWVPSGIMDWRGSMWFCEAEPSFGTLPARLPLLPIIHPAAIMRAWYTRAVTVHDLKARVPMALRGDWRPNPEPTLWAPPTFERAIGRLKFWLARAQRGEKFRLLCDIENTMSSPRVITCVGFADSTQFAMSIPFVRKTGEKDLASWWTTKQEAHIVHLIRLVLSHPSIQIEGQNFIHDTQHFQYWMGVTPNCDFDSMLCQNVIFPGTPKGLDYLSSLYCRYHWYWKEDAKEWDGKGTIEDLLKYNCLDCIRNWEVCESQRQVLTGLNKWPQMNLKMRTNDLCLRMMTRGVLIDRKRAGQLEIELSEALNGTYAELLKIIPQTIVDPDYAVNAAKKKDKYVYWYTSDKQTKYVLYDYLGMRKVTHRKTGNTTSGKEALMQLEKQYPEFTQLLRRLDLAGSVENTRNVIKSPLESDLRIRCSFSPSAETHRLKSSKNVFGRGTNLQNLTKGEEDD